MDENGIDVLTWRKGTTADIEPEKFTMVSRTDEHGEEKTWSVADTLVDLPLAATKKTVEVFLDKTDQQDRGCHRWWREANPHPHHRPQPSGWGGGVHRVGNRCRLENQFRYARLYFDLDSHDSYKSIDDDQDRMVPEPAKGPCLPKVVADRHHHAEAAAVADLNLLVLKTPPDGTD